MLHDDHVDLKLCENFLGATVRGGISRSFGHIPEAEPGLRVTGPRVIWSTILVNYFWPGRSYHGSLCRLESLLLYIIIYLFIIYYGEAAEQTT